VFLFSPKTFCVLIVSKIFFIYFLENFCALTFSKNLCLVFSKFFVFWFSLKTRQVGWNPVTMNCDIWRGPLSIPSNHRSVWIIGGMRVTRENRKFKQFFWRKPYCNITLSATQPTCTALFKSPGFHIEKMAISHLSYDDAVGTPWRNFATWSTTLIATRLTLGNPAGTFDAHNLPSCPTVSNKSFGPTLEYAALTNCVQQSQNSSKTGKMQTIQPNFDILSLKTELDFNFVFPCIIV